MILRAFENQVYNYYYFDTNGYILKKIESASGKNPDIEININYSIDRLPETLNIRHNDYDIDLMLEVLYDD